MSQKWNLQDIRPAEPRRRKTPTNGGTLNASSPSIRKPLDDDLSTIVIKSGEKKSKLSLLVVSVVVVVLLITVFSFSLLLSKTTLTVYPEFREPNVNAEFIAYPERREDSLSYEIMTLDESGERQVKATGEEHVEQQAKGTIEIIKTTTGSERLIKNTRFRTPDGLIFKIQESVVVPGALKDADGKLVPGTIRAEVFAAETGQEYNITANIRFDIPGFKESNLDALYNSIYAQNNEGFTGGFSGPKFIIDEGELSTAKQALRIELRDKLLERMQAEKPANFVTFTDAVALTYNTLPAVQYGDNLVTIKEQAVLQLPLFVHSDFASFLAKETITTYTREPVRITNIDNLKFSYMDSGTSATNIADLTSLSFLIIGKPLIVWEYDEAQLQADLVGKPKTSVTTVLTGHPGIDSAHVSGKPFWKRSFPDDSEDIEVIEVIGDDKEI
jgi:hypothetical protein